MNLLETIVLVLDNVAGLLVKSKLLCMLEDLKHEEPRRDAFAVCLVLGKCGQRKPEKKARARILPGICPARIEKIRTRSRSGQQCVSCG